MWEVLGKKDREVFDIIIKELKRQENGLELIASENFVSIAVMEAVGSIMTNKYAEGYPAKRYYGGCRFVDEAENLARDRAKRLFNANFVNVQPHSGSQANMAAYLAVTEPGVTIMGMSLSHGGHLTHGSPVNFSGKLFNVVAYGVDEDSEVIDYDSVRKLAVENRPAVIVAGGSAYSRIIDFKKFREIADEVGAVLMVDMAHFAGLVAAGLYPNPLDFAHIVTTTTHKTLRGPRGGMILTNDEEIGKSIDKTIFPGTQGGPLMHVIAAKAVSFGEALKDEFKVYQQNILNNAKKTLQLLRREGSQNRFRRNRHTPLSRRSQSEECNGKSGRKSSGKSRNNRKQEHHPERNEVAFRNQRYKNRNTGSYHQRNDRSRNALDSRSGRKGHRKRYRR